MNVHVSGLSFHDLNDVELANFDHNTRMKKSTILIQKLNNRISNVARDFII